jgi:oligopeptide/dipeptide ABC transporter ATP-binding protein
VLAARYHGAAVTQPIIEVIDARKHYPIPRGLGFLPPNKWVHALDGVSFQVPAGSTLGIVGESGCGKSTTGRLLLHLEEVTSGEIQFRGVPLKQLTRKQGHEFRKSVQAVFQDPYSSLSPRQRVRDIVAEPMVINQRRTSREVTERVGDVLELVGLGRYAADLYPHEFSGGQRQRVAIARAVSTNPSVIVLDEPVSALDVSIRAQVINLLCDLQERFALTYVLISHDFSVVEFMSDTVLVMYLGQIVESGSRETIWRQPAHPYTRALMAAAAPPAPGERGGVVSRGDVPSPVNLPRGCRFAPRCPLVIDRCRVEAPVLRTVASGHQAACHLV